MSGTAPTNVLIVGVGGQGVIMVSKVLAELCISQGLNVKQSEVHGMAKRGGAVFSHVRYGDTIHSPTIPKGEVDILVAMEWAEALRWLGHLRPGGILIADTQRIVPPFACLNRERGADRRYTLETPPEILELVATGHAFDAGGMARDLGNERASNTIILGALSTTLDFPADAWLEIIRKAVPPKTVEVNERAFAAGRAWVETTDTEVEPYSVKAEIPAAPKIARLHPDLIIRDAWCKSCDICVKMCPERCLALDEREIVVLTNPDACTGCRLCEWLCPDFAISVALRETERVAAE